MIKWAFVFLVVAVATGLLGFTSIAGAPFLIAKLLFFVAFAAFYLLMALGVSVLRKPAARASNRLRETPIAS